MDEGYEFELAIDWGTSKWVAALAVSQHGERKGEFSPLLIADRSREVPMMATWIDGKLVQGFELQKRADQDFTLSDKIIDLFKLALYRGPETSEITQRVEGMLAELPENKTLEDLIEDHIEAVIEDAKEAIRKSEEKMTFDNVELEKLLKHMKVRITVPEMWTPEARRRMQMAAKKAGLNIVVLASEAQCALAYLVHRITEKKVTLKRRLRKGDLILVADLGCGTGDFVLYKLLEDLNIDSKLQSVGHSSGDLCGSSRVDEILLDTLLKRKGREWRVKTIHDLGVTDRDFRRRALAAIEKAKREFNEEEHNAIGTIRGIKGRYKPFELSKKEIHDALDAVIERVFKAIDERSAKKKPDVIQVTGGFSKNAYLMAKLRRRYEKQGTIVVRPNDTDTAECLPVAIGALLRYDNISRQKLPEQYGYAMIRDEEFNPERHPDAFTPPKDWDGESEDKLKLEPWVKPSSYEPVPREGEEDNRSMWVLDRIINIIEKGTTITEGEVKTSREKDMIDYVAVKDPHITAKYVYLDKKVANYSPATRLVQTDEGEDVWENKKGIHSWGIVRIPISQSLLEEHGFEKVQTEDDGEFHWKLPAQVAVRCRGREMQAGFEITKPRKEPDVVMVDD